VGLESGKAGVVVMAMSVVPLPEPLLAGARAGARLFDDGEWWHAHEAWEEAWKAAADPASGYLKGLVQLAAAGYHTERSNWGAVANVAAKARRSLLAHQPERWPLPTGFLLCVAAALERNALGGRSSAHLPRLGLAGMMGGGKAEG